MMKHFPYHIQHNTTFLLLDQVVSLGKTGDVESWEVSERTGVSEADYRQRIVGFLRQIGVLQSNILGPFGGRLATLRDDRPELVGESVHLRLATMRHTQPRARFSLAYETMCVWLCERGDFTLDEASRSTLAGHVIEHAARVYDVDPGGIAFSKSSVNGGMIWLRATAPPALIIGSDQFARRNAVSALSVLWAIDALYRREGVPFGTRLSLTEDREACLAHWLLLDPNALTANLSLAGRTEGTRKTGTGSAWLTLGTEGGFGSWLLLTAPCPVGATQPNTDDSDLTPQSETETGGAEETEGD